jgi:hypothetical protein
VRYITVAELRQYAEKNAITAIVVHRSNTSYALVIRLNWRDEEHLVVSHHDRKPREWTSFDRLYNFLEREGVEFKDLVVKVNKPSEDDHAGSIS